MSKAGVSFEEMKSDMLKNEEFKIEYEKLKPRYEEKYPLSLDFCFA